MREFCPKCGTSRGPFVDGFCVNCFLQDNPVGAIPVSLPVVFCPRCEKIQDGRYWRPFSEAALEQLVLSRFKPKGVSLVNARVRLVPLGERKRLGVISFAGERSDVVLESDAKTVVELKHRLCDSCMRLSSDYFESILQVRFAPSISEPERRHVLEELHDHLDFLAKTDSMARMVSFGKAPNGFDLKLGSKKGGRKAMDFLARRYGGPTTVSGKLAGLDAKGRLKQRFTFCVRIPSMERK
ncbi:MAG: hypothetical protein HY917_04585 [Candidatus Diapherotrites archaeon]|nr:hypothetical protein [Candidatus Diapherotrites archaeon]